MFAFVLLFAVAFAQTAPTQAQCNFANAKWDNNKCVCNTTDLKVVLNGTTYECKKCEGDKPVYNETALACVAAPANNTNNTTNVTCNAALYLTLNTTTNNTCVCMEGFTAQANNTTVPCFCNATTHEIQNATNGAKKCVTKPAPGTNNTNTTNVTCNATLYLTLNTTSNQCVCMAGFAATNNATAPCICNATGANIIKIKDNDFKCGKCEGNTTYNATTQTCMPPAVVPGTNTTNTTNVTCDAKLYQVRNATSNQCVCMTGFATTNNATAPCVCNTTGANIIKIKDNDFRCGKCEGNTTYNATTQTCVQPANNTVSCNATLYLTLNATSNKCVCMTGFTSTNNATAPCACNTTGANIIKIKDNDFKCDKCGANQNYDAKTQTCVNKPNNGVNGLFVLLAMALFFLF